MNKQNGYIEVVKSYIQNYDNIFDIYILAFIFLRDNEASVLNNIQNNLDKYNKIRNTFDEILDEDNFRVEVTSENKKNLIKILTQNDNNIFIITMALFTSIENIFGSKDYKNSKDEFDLFGSEKVQKVEPLNSEKTIELGKVYHTEECFIEKMYTKKELPRHPNKRGSSILANQKNLLVKYSENSDYKVQLVKVKWSYVYEQMRKISDGINIALIPFTGDNRYIRFREDGSQIFVDSLNDVDKYTKRVIELLDSLKSKDVHIVVFPELVFSSEILKSVKQYLNKNKGHFLLIVSGSIWENQQNKCILISGDGIELGEQYKLNQFHKTDDFDKIGNNEGIILNSENRVINMFDIEKLGRISIPICVDFITKEFFSNLVAMGVNISLIPAYTESLSSFYDNAKIIGSNNNGIAFVANCCIPVMQRANTKGCSSEGLFAYIPLKRLARDEYFMQTCIPNIANCNCDSKNLCQFLVRLEKSYCTFKKYEV